MSINFLAASAQTSKTCWRLFFALAAKSFFFIVSKDNYRGVKMKYTNDDIECVIGTAKITIENLIALVRDLQKQNLQKEIDLDSAMDEIADLKAEKIGGKK